MAVSVDDLYRFNVRDFERMAEIGLFFDQRLELVDGLIVEMSPRGDRHAFAMRVLNELFGDQRRGRYHVNPENLTLRLGPRDTRDPDAALARANRSYVGEGTKPEDIALLVEVADSSLQYDLGAKRKTYAAAGIPEYWVVDIPHECVHVFREPNRFARTYLKEEKHDRDGVISPHEYPDVQIPIAQVFGAEPAR
jgi:Uma2 family endonuclease